MSALPENVFPLDVTGKMTASVVMVTPDMARRWLVRNTHNRRLKPTAIDRFVRDMLAGEWKLTGEGIKFGPDGMLLDGQNRLHACIKADVDFPTWVFRNVPADSQRVMDTGSARTAADALSIGGEKHASVIAAAVRLALAVDLDLADLKTFQPTHAEVESWLAANPSIRDAAEFASRYARRTDCLPSVVAYTTWVLSGIGVREAHQFWIDAAEKAGLAAGDPVIAMTNRFAEARRNRETLPKRAYLSIIYRAWNTRRRGSTARMMKVNSSAGGLIPIPVPK